MKISKIPGLGRFGIFIDDVDLQNIDHEQWMEIGQLHMKHLVTIIRNSNCTPDRQAELMLRFGDTRYGIKGYLLNKYKRPWSDLISAVMDDNDKSIDSKDRGAVKSAIQVIEKTKSGKDLQRVCGGYNDDGTPKGIFADGELLWHSNESGTLTWVPGVALLAYKNVVGSATGFLTTVDYYESVSESFRSELNDMIVVHKFTPGKINPGLNEQQDLILNLNMCPVEQEVPMVIQSPGGLTGLHYTVNTVSTIRGASEKESAKIFERINKELFDPKYIYDHWYQNTGDLCLFDNSITLHRRLGNIQDRLCYRVAHDYTHLQNSYYQPYFQPEFQKQYSKQIRQHVKLSGIKNFKLPPRHWSDFIPWLSQ